MTLKGVSRRHGWARRRVVTAVVAVGTVLALGGAAAAATAVPGASAPARPSAHPNRASTSSAAVKVACGDVAGLKAAIAAANATPNRTTIINLATRCTYTITAVDNGAGADANGLPVVHSPITVLGHGSTIVRSGAAGTPAFRICSVGTDGTLSLRFVTIAGGLAGAGGGIYNTGRLTMMKSVVKKNMANAADDTAGGGIYNTGTATLVHSQLAYNTVMSTGVAAGGGLENQGAAVLSHSRITHNTTRSSGDSAIGSGVDNGVDTTLTLNFSQLDHNAASSPTFAGGSAIANVGTAILNHSWVNDNTANSPITASGALRQVGPLMKLNATKVYRNTATGAGVVGGGIYTGVALELVNSDVFENTVMNTDPNASAEGAGIFVAGGTGTLTSSLVTRNKALGPGAQGAGIFLLGAATMTLITTTVTANVPDNCFPVGSIAGCVG